MSTWETVSLRTFLEIRSSKFNTKIPSTFLWKITKDFRKICLYVEKVDRGSQKRPTSVFLQDFEKLFPRPATELIFALKKFSPNLITGNNHSAWPKIYTWRKNLKATKNQFFAHGNLTVRRKLQFLTSNIEKIYNKACTAGEQQKLHLMLSSFYTPDNYGRYS